MLLSMKENILAYDFLGKRYDVGDKFGFIRATIEIALSRDDMKDYVYEYIRENFHVIAC
jgi:UTP--glucose-1-phosphate uridylyltransferase